mgnify:CR=1 FL=1
MNEYYSIHDILKIKTNVDLQIPNYFKVNDNIKKVDIEFVQKDISYTVPEERKKRSGAFFYWIDKKALNIEYEIPIINARMIIDDLEGETKVTFTKAFLKYGDVLGLFEVIFALKIIQKGYSIIHAGCLKYRNDGVLLVALRDTGKTSTVLSLLDGVDFRFMSDDQVIVNEEGKALCYPRKVNISPYTLTSDILKPSDDIVSRIKRRLARSRFEVIFGDMLKIKMGNMREVPRDLIEKEAKIKKVFVLSGGYEKEGVKELDRDDVAKRILVNTFEIYNLLSVYSLNFYYQLFDFDIFDLIDKQKRIVRGALKNAECYEVRANVVKRYPKMVKNILTGE